MCASIGVMCSLCLGVVEHMVMDGLRLVDIGSREATESVALVMTQDLLTGMELGPFEGVMYLVSSSDEFETGVELVVCFRTLLCCKFCLGLDKQIVLEDLRLVNASSSGAKESARLLMQHVQLTRKKGSMYLVRFWGGAKGKVLREVQMSICGGYTLRCAFVCSGASRAALMGPFMEYQLGDYDHAAGVTLVLDDGQKGAVL